VILPDWKSFRPAIITMAVIAVVVGYFSIVEAGMPPHSGYEGDPATVQFFKLQAVGSWPVRSWSPRRLWSPSRTWPSS
jgi:hypothetical protein